jgi:hypothetical protein
MNRVRIKDNHAATQDEILEAVGQYSGLFIEETIAQVDSGLTEALTRGEMGLEAGENVMTAIEDDLMAKTLPLPSPVENASS